MKTIKSIFEGLIMRGTDSDREKIEKKMMKKWKITNVNQLGRFEKQKYEDELEKAWKGR